MTAPSLMDAACTVIEKAVAAEDLFGTAATSNDIAQVFRRYARQVHPDHHQIDGQLGRAETAFTKLNRLREEADAKLADGTYGDRRPPAPAPTDFGAGAVTIEVRGQKYTIDRRLFVGSIADLYRAHDGKGYVAVKLARAPQDNDLLENEDRVLRKLDPASDKAAAARLLPVPRDSFLFRSPTSTRRINAQDLYTEHFSLVEVRKQHGVLDWRDVVWMFKRGLMALGWAHRRGIVHGAVLPPHILIHPMNHGIKLVDWCYAVDVGSPLCALEKDWRHFYPPEVFEKKPATAATDIFMLARSVQWLLDAPGHRSDVLDRFLAGCLLTAPAKRPDDAWKLHEELDELLARSVGKPRYRALAMPARK